MRQFAAMLFSVALSSAAFAQACLPDPTARCLNGVVLQALLERINAPPTGDWYDRLLGPQQLRENTTTVLISFAEAGEMDKVARILHALPPTALKEIAVWLVLANPTLAALPEIAGLARERALEVPGPSQVPNPGDFKNALTLLLRLGETEAVRAKAHAAEANFFAIQAASPEDRLSTEMEDVVMAFLMAAEPSSALAFLEKAEPLLDNAYQWMVVAEALIDAQDCPGALALADRVPRKELNRMGSVVLPVIAACRGIEAAIELGRTMPTQELEMFTWPLIDEGRHEEALAVAEALDQMDSERAKTVRRRVARARAEAGEFEEQTVMAGLENADPYPLARTRTELALAKAKAGQPDPDLTRRAAEDIRKIDPDRIDPYSLADLFLLQGFAQTWVPADPAHLSVEAIEAQLTRMTPAARDDFLGILEAPEEAAFLALSLIALETALGRNEKAREVSALYLTTDCGPGVEDQIGCMVISLDVLTEFAAPGPTGDLPERIWALAEPMADPDMRAQVAAQLASVLTKRP